jgi:uncharacterized protein YecE (DUF72 family)
MEYISMNLPQKEKLFIGTSGFQFEDWVGPVYPADLPKDARLYYYWKTLGFNALELNYTYYRLPSARTSLGLLKKVGPEFTFVVRSHREMTHEIWADPWRERLKDNRLLFEDFKKGLEPLHRSGQLGCLLLQFPTFFLPTRENLRYLRYCAGQLAGYPLAVEFRHRAWDRDRAFSFLASLGLGTCVVDEPPLPPLMPLRVEVTAEVAYLRLHGRNRRWFNASREERYHYNYSPEELNQLLPAARRLLEQADRVFIFFNNCHGGWAVKNAREFKKLLARKEEREAE